MMGGRTVRLWDPNTGELLSTLRGHTKGVWACKFYPVGHTSALLASVGEDATCRLWDTRSRKVALTLSGAHQDAIYCLDWSNDGAVIATGSVDKTVRGTGMRDATEQCRWPFGTPRPAAPSKCCRGTQTLCVRGPMHRT